MGRDRVVLARASGPRSRGWLYPTATVSRGAQMGRHDDHGRNGHSRDVRRSRWRTGRRGRGPRRGGRWSRTRVEEGSASRSGIPPIGAGGVGQPPPGPGPSSSPSAEPGSNPGPSKSTNRESATTRIPHGSPDMSTSAANCSPGRATNPTSSGKKSAMKTPANRSQNLDRRRRGGPPGAGSSWQRGNTTPRRALIGPASIKSTTTTTFMPRSYHSRNATASVPGG